MNMDDEINDRYFEDYHTGDVHILGEIEVEEEEMLAFARSYDPQGIHTDQEKAAAGPFKGLIASGWFTGGLMMRLYAKKFLSEVSSIASPGLDEIRWQAPVRSGDVLAFRVTVLETRRSRSKPDRGIVKSFTEILNQEGVVVMSIKNVNVILCRNPSPP
jgi:acyl dehydratase